MPENPYKPPNERGKESKQSFDAWLWIAQAGWVVSLLAMACGAVVAVLWPFELFSGGPSTPGTRIVTGVVMLLGLAMWLGIFSGIIGTLVCALKGRAKK